MEQLVDLDKINIRLHLSDDLNLCLSKVDIFFSKFKNDGGKYFQLKIYTNSSISNFYKWIFN